MDIYGIILPIDFHMFFHFIYGMSSFPLTNSIIFRDGEIAPPTSLWGQPCFEGMEIALLQFVDQRINVDYIGCGFPNGISMVISMVISTICYIYGISMFTVLGRCCQLSISVPLWRVATRCVVPGVLRRCAIATARDRSRPIITGWWFGTFFSIYWE